MNNKWRIPYSEPFLNEKTRIDLLDAFDASELSGNGVATRTLESQLSSLLNTEFGLTVSNGSAALRLAFQSLGLRPGMKVILPGWGFHVASNVAHSMGASIEYIDVDIDSWCMDLDLIEECIESDNDNYIVLIHTLGNSSHLEKTEKVKKLSNVHIIEDAAEAIFSSYKGSHLGTLFDVGTYSFHAAKTVTTGEGGFITLGNQKLFEVAKLLRNHGMTPDRPYFHHLPGDNFRLSNLLSAIGLSQIENINVIIEKRKNIYQQYFAELKDSKAKFLLPTDPDGFFPWGVGVRCGKYRDEVMKRLQNVGIDSRPGFSSAALLPYFDVAKGDKQLTNSSTLANEVVLLPHYPSLTQDVVSEICEVVSKCLN
jgi:perosamine synthetase